MKKRLKALGRFSVFMSLAAYLGFSARQAFKTAEEIEELDYVWFVELLLVGLEMALGAFELFAALLVFIPAIFVELPCIIFGDKVLNEKTTEEEIEA